MQRYIAHRILASIPVLFLVAIFIFGLLHVAGGDPAAIMAGGGGGGATEEQIARIRTSLGLDRPLHVQLGTWFRDLFTGDLGRSINSNLPVTTLVRSRLVPTISLVIVVEVVAIPLSVFLGTLAAWKANTWIDRGVMIFASLGFSIPIFFLGFLLIFAFAAKIPLFPAAGYFRPTEDFPGYLYRLLLPGITTAIVFTAFITRMTRATMIEALNEDYIRTARAKGLPESAVLIRHALKNAALPIVTVIGWGFAELLTGIIVTEQVFAIPGIGRLIVDAISRRDYPVIQGTMLVVSAVQIVVNLMVDVSYSFFDPRIKY